MSKDYLILPASANYKNLPLDGVRGAILTGTVADASLIGGGALDMTVLFGAMQDSTEYPLTISYANSEPRTVYLIKSANVPSIHIKLDGGLSYVHKNKDNKVSGHFAMLDASGKVIAEAPLEYLKGRGNSTWNYSGEKKPYNIKLEEKLELIAGAGKSKSWCLLNNNLVGNDQHDRTGLYNIVAYNMFVDLNGDSALKSQTVDLYINGEYRGSYFLVEKVHIDKQRVNITEPDMEEDEKHVTRIIQPNGTDTAVINWNRLPAASDSVSEITLAADTEDRAILAGVQTYQYATNSVMNEEGGFITEIDSSYWAEASWFVTRRGVVIVVKEPEFATKEQVQDIAIYVQEFEDALYSDSGYNDKGKRYTEYMDIESLAKRFILDCFIANADLFDGSSFHYIDALSDESSILKAGPAWDYDASSPSATALFHDFVGRGEVEARFRYRKIWAEQLMTKGDFVAELNKLAQGTLKSKWALLNSKGIQSYIDEISASQTMNGVLHKNNFASYAATFKTAMANRYEAWYGNNGIWTNKNLMGVTISESEGTLVANIEGTASAYQWYKVNDDYTVTAIDGAVNATYTPTQEGVYVVAVTGGNISYNPALPSEYTTVSQETMTMFSNAIQVNL